MPEHGYFLQVASHPQSVLPKAPAGAVFLSRCLVQWELFQAETRSGKVGVRLDLDADKAKANDLAEICKFGFPVKLEEFVAKAVQAGHPFHFEASLDAIIKTVVEDDVCADEFALQRRGWPLLQSGQRGQKHSRRVKRPCARTWPRVSNTFLRGNRLLLWAEMI